MPKLKDLLKDKLTNKELALLPSSYDILGSILIFSDFPNELIKKEKLIGEVLIKHHKNIKTVCKKTKKFSGKYRLPKLKIITGEKTLETTYKENNITLKLNVEKVYFSQRLSTERKRIYKLIKPNEEILVMFSGCGPYPIVIAKNSKPKEIYSIEMNPTAYKYQKENIKLNKINNIKLFKADVKKTLPKINKKFDRILMPLPKGAEKFLDIALSKIKKNGIVHLYDFTEENKYEKIIKNIDDEHKKRRKKYKILNIVKCGQFSPRKYRVCIDFKVL
jgi:tRNA (guanine37-N1)-methyltransferase